MDGLDVIRELRLWESRERPDFRQYVIGISAHASDNDAEHGIVLGMNSYQNKPLKLQDLQKIANCDDVLAAGNLLDRMGQKRKAASIQANASTPQKGCLIATDDFARHDLSGVVQGLGWLSVTASSKNDFLHQLRSRNWDAILLDGDLPEFAASVHEFREWESCNRVRRQHNLFLLSSGYTPARASTLSLVELPTGVDGVLGKPTSTVELEKMLSMAAKGSDSVEFSKRDIVTR
jgi:CheY-like chemotaxis protein